MGPAGDPAAAVDLDASARSTVPRTPRLRRVDNARPPPANTDLATVAIAEHLARSIGAPAERP